MIKLSKSKCKKNDCWITWHFSTRSRNLAKTLNVSLYELSIEHNIFWRHLGSSLWTIWILIKKRPMVVYLQNSFLLLLIITFYKHIRFKKVLVICDCHTKSLRRKAPGIFNYIFWPLKKISFKYVDLTIVSNKYLEKESKLLNNNTFILPDKIPVLHFKKNKKRNYKYCVYINSFAIDEPFQEIFDVAFLLEPEIRIFVTGKIKKGIKIPSCMPNNLLFTDYLSFEKYFNLIGNADCILALTKEEDCLQCGAYEALSLNIPMVLSNTKAIRSYFDSAAIYTNNDPENISKSIIKAIENKEEIKKDIAKIKKVRDIEFSQKLDCLISTVEQIKNCVQKK